MKIPFITKFLERITTIETQLQAVMEVVSEWLRSSNQKNMVDESTTPEEETTTPDEGADVEAAPDASENEEVKEGDAGEEVEEAKEDGAAEGETGENEGAEGDADAESDSEEGDGEKSENKPPFGEHNMS